MSARRLELLACAVLAALAAWLLFADLGRASFHDGDEALYAAVSRGMARGGDWLTPSYWGRPFLHKPPLAYWLMSAAHALVPGTLELRARAPSALAGLLTLALAYWTARRLAGPWAGAGAVLLLLLNHQFLFEHSVRSAVLDAPLVALMFASVAAGIGAGESRRALHASAACAALVLMVKAPMVLFVAVPLAAYLWSEPRRAALRWLAACAVWAAVVALPWHAYALVAHGRELWDAYVVYEILGRTGAASSDAESSAWVHVEAAWHGFLPWSPLLLLAVVAGLLGWPRSAGQPGARRLLAGYAVLVLVFFCALPVKWPWYGLPALPAAAVLGAVLVTDLLAGPRRRAVPLALAALAVLRWVFLRVEPGYDPVSRASWRWPEHTRLFALATDGVPAHAWVLAALAGLCAAAPWLLRSRAWVPAASTLALAALLFGASLWTVAAVPRVHESATAALVRRLETRGVERLLTVYFERDASYGDRQKPLTSVYFLELAGGEATDCRGGLDCLDAPSALRTALVVDASTLGARRRKALTRRLAALDSPPEVWILDPGSPGGFGPFEWR